MPSDLPGPGEPPAPGEQACVEIEDLDGGGFGTGSWPSARPRWRVRVPGVFPGERARVRIEHVSSAGALAFARPLGLERPLPTRRPAACPHHPDRGGGCGGCPWMTLDEAAQRELKAALVASHHGLHLDRVIAGEPLGYRWSSKRVAGGRAGQLVLGSYQPRSHTVASMRECLVDHPRIVDCFAELEQRANALAIEPFDERTRSGELRYVWAKCDGNEVLLTLVSASETTRVVSELAPALSLPAGVAVSVQAARGNAIRGAPARLLRGRDRLRLSLAGVEIEPGPLGFLQPNPAVAARAYEDLLLDAGGAEVHGGLALDLYAGAGVVTRRLRARFERVHACEAYPESAEDLGIEPLDVADFLERADGSAGRPRLVVANPPRAGMGERVCEALLRLEPELITIMSCNADSLARDLVRLGSSYVVQRVRGYDTLPQTGHLELVAWLEHRSNSGT